MKRMLLIAALVLVALPAATRAADPSATCDAALVPPATTPAAVGARLDSATMTTTGTVCVANAALPWRGSVRAKADGNARSAVVSVDGDPWATMLGCTDGYLAAGASPNGPALYYSSDGGFTSRARAKSLDEIAAAAAKDCPPASA